MQMFQVLQTDDWPRSPGPTVSLPPPAGIGASIVIASGALRAANPRVRGGRSPCCGLWIALAPSRRLSGRRLLPRAMRTTPPLSLIPVPDQKDFLLPVMTLALRPLRPPLSRRPPSPAARSRRGGGGDGRAAFSSSPRSASASTYLGLKLWVREGWGANDRKPPLTNSWLTKLSDPPAEG